VFERFTERARQAVVLAQDEARAFKHDYIGTEHLLLGLLREEEGLAARVLGSLHVTLDEMREQVGMIVGRGDITVSGQIPFTPRSKKVLELALREALSLGHNYIGTEHILLGLIRENEGVATQMLLDCDVDAEKIRNRMIDLVPALGRSLAMPRPRPSPGLARRAPVKPLTWEYLVEHWPAEERAPRTERLSALGAERWQLAAVVPGPETSEWVFQRPARPSQES
jgi:Clp amino terminal domain, pathogenicity island component